MASLLEKCDALEGFDREQLEYLLIDLYGKIDSIRKVMKSTCCNFCEGDGANIGDDGESVIKCMTCDGYGIVYAVSIERMDKLL